MSAAMLIPLVSSSGEVTEWALVELQGRVEQQLDIEPGAPLPVGTLQLSPAVRGRRGRQPSAPARPVHCAAAPQRPHQLSAMEPRPRHSAPARAPRAPRAA